MRLTATPPPHADCYQRQIALVDVDEGEGAANLSFAQQVPGAKLPRVAATARSYVVDVFRVSGGPIHTYGFHGPLYDAFHWNVNEQPVKTITELLNALKPGSTGAPQRDVVMLRMVRNGENIGYRFIPR